MDEIHNVCNDCGIEANRRTCLKKYGAEPLKRKYSLSTYHNGVCDWCKKEKQITEVRDFFYPDFSLMEVQRD
jgi:hypothetical protein